MGAPMFEDRPKRLQKAKTKTNCGHCNLRQKVFFGLIDKQYKFSGEGEHQNDVHKEHHEVKKDATIPLRENAA